jgi:Mor family transcriptional regulator
MFRARAFRSSTEKGSPVNQRPTDEEIERALAALDPISLDIMKDIHARFRGESVYFSKCRAMKLAKRNQAILAEFDGGNRRAIARRYGLSLVRIYQIINREQKSV